MHSCTRRGVPSGGPVLLSRSCRAWRTTRREKYQTAGIGAREIGRPRVQLGVSLAKMRGFGGCCRPFGGKNERQQTNATATYHLWVRQSDWSEYEGQVWNWKWFTTGHAGGCSNCGARFLPRRYAGATSER